ncbi:potassium channel family protein [Propionibacterium australiense]|uniref:Trk system potassium uptake protein TrkA n=1 Tax=Propionibacterium australiense TaxID=119981 RepID=A0A383S4G4_9ACTN|nr:TrkA family potassium uptake protein [Propionibacterium australiense]RLP10677.1 NAD-dependent epimerase/dehydratase family protein [Propionibacterium australiense]RLP12972.1 NAD-dependent epimerase/dehydratase family protein [Propionibacterium australiense]SYZ32885.1 Regulator of K+ conductance, C-terminal [Propionibacterium australiense]VEH91059.1 Trk system potassium uptake protein trkA [Propionibacterium australiense]
MRISIAGAGNVGRSIARELLANGHEVLLIEKDPHAIRSDAVPEAEWLLADACEMDSLAEAGLETCDVIIAATGDDKANLVYALLAKTEFGVPRTVTRINHPENEWLFTEQWGVDVAVSTPRIMSALVEEAVSVGAVVRLLSFNAGSANLVELTLPASAPAIGRRVRDLELPGDGVLVAIIRAGQARPPRPDETLEEGDELLFTISAEHERQLPAILVGSGSEAPYHPTR